MQKIETLIDLSRKATENSDFTDTTGIQTDEFIQYFTDGIRRIESVINFHFPKAFLKEKEISIDPGTTEVSVPVDVFLGTRLLTVEFKQSPSSNTQYYQLKKSTLQERFGGITGAPSFYIRKGNKIIFTPGSQSGGTLRLVYQKAQPAADIRRAEIASVTTSGSSTLTGITLKTTTTIDIDGLNRQESITVVDRFGNVKAANIAISSIDQNTGVVTFFQNKSIDSDETMPAADDYVCAGAYSSNICLLPDIVERYLLSYVNWKIFRRDSNTDNVPESQELTKLEEDIVNSYKDPDGDVDYVAILDSQYVGIDEYGPFV